MSILCQILAVLFFIGDIILFLSCLLEYDDNYTLLGIFLLVFCTLLAFFFAILSKCIDGGGILTFEYFCEQAVDFFSYFGFRGDCCCCHCGR